jgi:glutamine synthetase
MAGIDGIKNKIDPSAENYGPYDINLYDLTAEEKKKIKSLPRSLEESLEYLRQDNDFLTVGGVFPKRLLEVWIAQKSKEAMKVNLTPHPAEFGLYYDI